MHPVGAAQRTRQCADIVSRLHSQPIQPSTIRISASTPLAVQNRPALALKYTEPCIDHLRKIGCFRKVVVCRERSYALSKVCYMLTPVLLSLQGVPHTQHHSSAREQQFVSRSRCMHFVRHCSANARCHYRHGACYHQIPSVVLRARFHAPKQQYDYQLYCIKCEAGSIMLLHEGTQPLLETPYPSFGITNCSSCTDWHRSTVAGVCAPWWLQVRAAPGLPQAGSSARAQHPPQCASGTPGWLKPPCSAGSPWLGRA